MATISPSDSVQLHEFLTKGPDRFATWFPAAMVLAGLVLSQAFEWLRRIWEGRREDRRFIQQRLWDRRADAYADILRSLVRFKAMVDAQMGNLGAHATGTAAELERWREAQVVLVDAMGQGLFMISDAAQECLEELRKEFAEGDLLRQTEGYDIKLVADQRALKKAISKFGEIARHNLGVEHVSVEKREGSRP